MIKPARCVGTNGKAVRFADGLNALDDAKASRCCSTVCRALFVGCSLRYTAHEADSLNCPANTRQIMRAVAGTGSKGEPFLHDAVFARVVRQHHDTAPRHCVFDGLIECIGEHIEFAVDFDPDRLKSAFRGMATGASGRRRDRARDNFGQFGSCGDRACRNDRSRDSLEESLVAVLLDDGAEFVFAVPVDNV